jgi:adenylate cyclase
MVGRNADVAEARRMRFRIGINQGDVVFDASRVYGDGVNVAARLESLAEPGGICISRKVYEEVANKMQLAFVDLGEQQLKNIAQPVRVYRVSSEQL